MNRITRRDSARALPVLIAITGALAIALNAAALLRDEREANAQTQNRAGLVVRYGDGTYDTYCVAFGEASLTGYELLRRSGTAFKAEVGGVGTMICKIGNDGCDYPEQECGCKFASEGRYWSYWLFNAGQWVYSNQGAGRSSVVNGDIQGWVWGTGRVDGPADTKPPILTLDQICSAAAASPTPTPSATPSSTAGLTPSPTLDPYAGIQLFVTLTPVSAPSATVAIAATVTQAPAPAPTPTPVPVVAEAAATLTPSSVAAPAPATATSDTPATATALPAPQESLTASATPLAIAVDLPASTSTVTPNPTPQVSAAESAEATQQPAEVPTQAAIAATQPPAVQSPPVTVARVQPAARSDGTSDTAIYIVLGIAVFGIAGLGATAGALMLYRLLRPARMGK